ncbi:MAG: 4-hydroxythreonine-4-phosphate dehydrogenase PdxA [Thermoanaerobaculia bacterium]
MPTQPVLALTQGDPAGIGPEILLKLVAGGREASSCRQLLIAERSALECVQKSVPAAGWDRLVFMESVPSASVLADLESTAIAVFDPVGSGRKVVPGRSRAADAAGAMAALDTGIALGQSGVVDALVTAPISKSSIARHYSGDFRGHTDYIAQVCNLDSYGRDYLMAFLAPDLQVALVSTHISLSEAIRQLDSKRIVEALNCLSKNCGGSIAVAGLNPHAGEEGLLGTEDRDIVAPAIEQFRDSGATRATVFGPESPDSVFVRARRGEFDWVLALYHDQGLIAVKTVAFGAATNWTVGLPFIRTSVDHGTAFALAGTGRADVGPLERVVATTLQLIAGKLPRSAATSM